MNRIARAVTGLAITAFFVGMVNLATGSWLITIPFGLVASVICSHYGYGVDHLWRKGATK